MNKLSSVIAAVASMTTLSWSERRSERREQKGFGSATALLPLLLPLPPQLPLPPLLPLYLTIPGNDSKDIPLSHDDK